MAGETKNKVQDQSPEQQQVEAQQKIIKEITDAIKDPKNAEKIQPLLNENFSNMLKQDPTNTKKLLWLAKGALEKKDDGKDNADTRALQNLVAILDPIAKTQDLQTINVKGGKAEGYNANKGKTFLEDTKTKVENTENFEGKEIITKALSNPTIQNIITLQKFLYANIEDQTVKTDLQKNSVKNGQRDGKFGERTANAVNTFVTELQTDQIQAKQATNLEDTTPISMTELLKDGTTETVDNIDGSILKVAKVVEKWQIKEKTVDMTFNNMKIKTLEGINIKIIGGYNNWQLNSTKMIFTVKDKKNLENVKNNATLFQNQPDVNIQTGENTLTLQMNWGVDSEDQKVFDADTAQLKELMKSMKSFFNGEIGSYIDEKIYTKEPLIKDMELTRNNTSYTVFDTDKNTPLRLTTPEKGISLDNLSWTGRIQVTDSNGEKKIIQVIDGKIQS